MGDIMDFNFDQYALLTSLRDFKLRVITGDVMLFIRPEAISKFKKELNFIQENFPGDIITGSLALSLYGLLSRPISDIDIIIPDKSRYDSYHTSMYGTDSNNAGIDRGSLGYRMFEYKRNWFFKDEYKVDFFENNSAFFNEFIYKGSVLKVHSCLDILDEKLSLVQPFSKHASDLNRILK